MQEAAELVAEDEGWAGRVVPMQDVPVGATDPAGQNLHHAPTRAGPRHRGLQHLKTIQSSQGDRTHLHIVADAGRGGVSIPQPPLAQVRIAEKTNPATP